jgi:hypothetical protein
LAAPEDVVRNIEGAEKVVVLKGRDLVAQSFSFGSPRRKWSNINVALQAAEKSRLA